MNNDRHLALFCSASAADCFDRSDALCVCCRLSGYSGRLEASSAEPLVGTENL